MGRAQILSGGTSGRYTVRIDYGAAKKAATIATLNEAIASLTTKIAAQQTLVNDLKAKEDQARARYVAATTAYIESAQSRELAEAKTRVQAAKTAAETAHDEAEALLSAANSALSAATSERDARLTDVQNLQDALAELQAATAELAQGTALAEEMLAGIDSDMALQQTQVNQREVVYQQAVDSGSGVVASQARAALEQAQGVLNTLLQQHDAAYAEVVQLRREWHPDLAAALDVMDEEIADAAQNKSLSEQQVELRQEEYDAAVLAGEGVEEALARLQAARAALSAADAAYGVSVHERNLVFQQLLVKANPTTAEDEAVAAIAAAQALVPAAETLVALRQQEQQLALANERVAKAAADGAATSSEAAQTAGTLDNARLNAQQAMMQYKAELLQASSDLTPARIALDKLSGLRANYQRMVAEWSAFDPYVTKQVWCADLTEDGSGANVAAIDINGETSHTLLAPGCRAWSAGDGTILLADKTAQEQALLDAEYRAQQARNTNTASIESAVAEETRLKARVKELQAMYRNAPSAEGSAALTIASQALSNVQQDILTLRGREATLTNKIRQLQRRQADLADRPASTSPNFGDGLMTAPQVMSPEQAFLTAAVMPGWQKWRPTYRTGTITALDVDADTASVSLDAAASSAQGLGINQTGSLSNVPVSYMTCNAKAFEVGDRCVVRFTAQDWSRPVVIGFVDNPKPCETFVAFYSISGRQSGNGLISQQTKYRNQNWDPVEAPSPIQPVAWAGWNDGVTTRARSDGKATANRNVLGSYISGGTITMSIVTVSVSWSSQWVVEQPNGSFKKFGIAHLVWSTAWTGSAGGSSILPSGFTVPTYGGEVDNTVEIGFDENPGIYVAPPSMLDVAPTLTFSFTNARGTFTFFATPGSGSSASSATYVPQTVSPLSV